MNRKIIGLALALALIAVTMMPVGALAATQTGTTTASGVLAASYTLNVPADFAFSSFTTAGASKTGQTLTASTAGGTETTVTVTAADLTGNAGFLKNGSTPLSTALHLQITGQTEITLSGTDQAIITTAALTSGSWTTSALSITQPAFTQVVAGSYSTTITFTATFQ